MSVYLDSDFVCRLAIDLIGGQVVRLRQGDFQEKTIYSDDPVAMAVSFQEAGVSHLHLVDLDGAKAGQPMQLAVLERIAKAVDLKLDWSGGLKSPALVQAAFDAGASQVAIGSLAVKQRDVFLQILDLHGAEKVILAADVLAGEVLVSGWQQASGIQLDDFLSGMYTDGVRNLLCTDVQQDGMLSGPSVQLYSDLVTAYPALNVIASGGVSCYADLVELQSFGVRDAIIGRAFYDGQITLDELTKHLPDA